MKLDWATLLANHSQKSFESTLSDYLTRHGLFASKARFYFLTTKKSFSQTVKDVNGKEDLCMEESFSKGFMSSSNTFLLMGTSPNHSLASPLDLREKNDWDVVF